MVKKKVGVGFLVGLVVGLTVASVMAGPRENRKDALIEDFFDPLVWLVTQIDRRYVEEVEPEELVRGAYQGILSKLDDYSAYIPPDRLNEFDADIKGEFGGLGINIRYLPIKKAVLIEQAIPGTPAFRAGVLPGDMIVKVKEQSTGEEWETADFEDVHDAVRILRGEPGKTVTITVVHENSREVEEISVTREKIQIPGVRAVHMIDEENQVGYVYVAYFHEHTVADLRKAIAKLRDQGARGVILDLRFNPGGLLHAAVELADLFLDGSVIVSTRGRRSPEHVLRARHGEQYPDLSVVVLVNRGSASASEIVAAALAENGRATIVGEPTFGKASVQTRIDVPTGGAVKMTTAHYFTPTDQLIEEKGVTPKEENLIELSDEDLEKLVHALDRRNDFPPPLPEEQSGEKTEAEKEVEELLEGFEDKQLTRALEVMRRQLAGTEKPEPADAQAAVAAPQG